MIFNIFHLSECRIFGKYRFAISQKWNYKYYHLHAIKYISSTYSSDGRVLVSISLSSRHNSHRQNYCYKFFLLYLLIFMTYYISITEANSKLPANAPWVSPWAYVVIHLLSFLNLFSVSKCIKLFNNEGVLL